MYDNEELDFDTKRILEEMESGYYTAPYLGECINDEHELKVVMDHRKFKEVDTEKLKAISKAIKHIYHTVGKNQSNIENEVVKKTVELQDKVYNLESKITALMRILTPEQQAELYLNHEKVFKAVESDIDVHPTLKLMDI